MKAKKANIEDCIYPLTIVKDRYGGAYSNGKYTAWNLKNWAVPDEISKSDCECSDFWNSTASRYIIGKGDTIEEAVVDLAKQLGILSNTEKIVVDLG